MKKCFLMVLIMVGVLSLSVMRVSADEETSVFLNEEEATKVYSTVLSQSDFVYYFREKNLTMSKEQIMPLYEFSMLDYAWDDSLSLEHQICTEHSQDNTTGNVYAARLNYGDHEYAGYVVFCVEKGKGHLHSFVPSPQYEATLGNTAAKNIAVIDYLDNKDVIMEAFGEEPDEKNVRLVHELVLGYGFYISSEEKGDVFVYAGSTSGEPVSPAFLSGQELKDKAEAELENYLNIKTTFENAKKKWEEEHPDEPFRGMGPIGSTKYPMNYLDEKIALKEQETETESVEETEETVTEEETTQVAESTEEATAPQESKQDNGISQNNDDDTPLTTWLIPGLAIVLLLLFLGAYLLVKKNK